MTLERPRVKICGVKSPAEALLAAELGADMIGLNFHPLSPRFLELDAAKEISAALRSARSLAKAGSLPPAPLSADGEEREPIGEGVPLSGSPTKPACEAELLRSIEIQSGAGGAKPFHSIACETELLHSIGNPSGAGGAKPFHSIACEAELLHSIGNPSGAGGANPFHSLACEAELLHSIGNPSGAGGAKPLHSLVLPPLPSAGEGGRGERVPRPSPLLVGVFVHHSAEEAAAISEEVGLDLLQFHGNLKPAAVAPIAERALVALRADGRPNPEELEPWREIGVWGLIVDASHPSLFGGTGKSWDFASVAGLARPGERLLIAGGLHPGNLLSAIEAARPWGVDLCSGLESAPGIRDSGRLRELFRTLEHSFPSA